MSNERREQKNSTPEPKPQLIDTLRREIERTARQLEGMSKNLKRLHERIKEAT